MPLNRRVLCAVLSSFAALLSGCGGGASAIVHPTPANYTLTVNSTNPASGVAIAVSPADNNNTTGGTTSFTLTYSAAASVTLTAPATSGTNTFSSWTGCTSASAATCTVEITANTTVTANYTTPSATTYTLTVNSTNPASGVAIAASPADNNNTTNGTTSFTLTYNAGTAVTLTAPATSGGNNFASWAGCTTAAAATCAVTINANTTVTANYAAPAPTTYTLTVNSTDPSSGVAIGAAPADNNGSTGGSTSFTLTYNSGTSVTLTAPAVSDTNTFTSWTGCTSTNADACTVTLSANTAVTANYTTPVTPPPPTYTLTVGSTNPASGVAVAVSPADNNGTATGTTGFALNYSSGTTVTLTAPASSGPNIFSSWTGCTSTSALACTVAVSADATVTANYTAASAFQGQVLSGGLAVSGATIQIYAVGAAGNGSAATPMLTQTVTTNIAGQFAISGDFTCGQSSTGSTIAGSNQVYLVATGGTDSSTSTTANTAISMVAAIGPCTNLSSASTVTVNEITTAAAAWALAPFTTSITNVGASATNAQGITNAFLDAALLANPVTGAPTTLPANLVIETGKLNALADALAGCVDTASCTALFSAATPASAASPADTFTAALNIVQNPGQNVAAVYAAIPATPAYATTLTQSPNDWTMSLTVTGGGLASPTALGIDSLGNVWVANQDGPLSGFSAQGTPLSSTGFGGGNGATIAEVYGLAVDSSNNIWVTLTNGYGGAGAGSVTEFYGVTSTSGTAGTVAGNYGTDIAYPAGISADTNGDIFVANTLPTSATVLNNTGGVVSADLGSSYSLSLIPQEIAVDANHGFWLPGGETVAHVSAASSAYPNGQLLSNTTCCGLSAGVATDAQGNLWVADDLGGPSNRGAFADIAPDGTLILSGVVTGGISYPTGVAVDAAQNVWFSNLYGRSITEIAGNGGAIPAGTAISPTTGVYSTGGYGLDAGLDEPTGIVPDRSGNVWVVNDSVYNVTMFFGLATPTVTPLQPVPTAP